MRNILRTIMATLRMAARDATGTIMIAAGSRMRLETVRRLHDDGHHARTTGEEMKAKRNRAATEIRLPRRESDQEMIDRLARESEDEIPYRDSALEREHKKERRGR